MRKPLIAITILYILILVLMSELGILDKIPKTNIAREASGIDAEITGKIVSPPEEKTNKTSFMLETKCINGKSAEGKILVNVYFPEDVFSYGDIIEAEGKFFRLTPPSNPGVFDYKKYLQQKRIYAALSIVNKDNIKIIGKKPSPLWQLSVKLRRQILDVYGKNLPARQAAVISGITIGEKSGLDSYIQKIFVDAGVMHVLVVSGSNVAFVSIIFFWIFRNIFRLKKKTAYTLLLPIILVYTMIVGANPPVVRASIMTAIVIVSMLLSRNPDVYQGIFLAALIILIYNPLTLFESGFQMSFAATIGIIYLFPKFKNLMKMHKLPAPIIWLLSIFIVSLSAQIAVAPLMAYYFNKVSLIAVISNLVILPMIGVLLASGFSLYISSFMGIQILSIAAKITGIFISATTTMVDFFANIPYSTVMTAPPTVFFMIFYYTAAAGIPKFKNYLWKPAVIASSCILLILFAVNTFPSKKPFSVTFIDVGLGDAVYCEYPNGLNMLIDGGGSWDPAALYDIGETVVSPVILNRGRTSIDTVVLTHPHINHYQGLIAVAENFRVHKFITVEEESSEDEYKELTAMLKKKSIYIEKIKKGEDFENGPVQIKILNPEKITQNSDRNSLVMKMVYDNFSILFCGDSPRITQNILTETAGELTVLLVPGHGKKLLMRDFLLKISPEFAIISTDKPSPMVLEQLAGCRVFSTSDSGAITVETDGKTWKIKETVKPTPTEMIILK